MQAILRVSVGFLCLALGCGTPPGTSGTDAGGNARDAAVLPSDAASPSRDAPFDAGPFDAARPPPGLAGAPMPLISRGVPAFASSTDADHGPQRANDTSPNLTWSSATIPASLAYDLSGVPEADRQSVLVALYAAGAPDYFAHIEAWEQLPLDYTIASNDAPGGGVPPETGWNVLTTVHDNAFSSREHLVDLHGGNWIRIEVTRASDVAHVGLDMDVHAAPSGVSDAWLFMGDSITFTTLTYAGSDLPTRVNTLDPTHWPAVICGAQGGTNTTSALAIIDDAMREFLGPYVVLAYGTNDHATELHMEELVQHVIAAGRIPVIPSVPWRDQNQADPIAINAAIDQLAARYPQIVRGPDLWTFFTDRNDLIAPGDIHPNDQGRAELRRLWAEAMVRIYAAH